MPVLQPDVPELDPAAGVGAAAVELHRHGRRRRALDVRVRQVADLHPRALQGHTTTQLMI